MFLKPDDPLAVEVTKHIRTGDTESLAAFLQAHPQLAKCAIGDSSQARSLLHVATDWPGHLPNIAKTIEVLTGAGAPCNTPFIGKEHSETPLHWAASADDLDALEALLNAGADINATGGVIANGTALTDARAFRQYNAARRLLDRSASVTLQDAAALGLISQIKAVLDDSPNPLAQSEVDFAFWNACHGGQLAAARLLHDKGADVKVVPPWSRDMTALEAARESRAFAPAEAKAPELVEWLESL